MKNYHNKTAKNILIVAMAWVGKAAQQELLMKAYGIPVTSFNGDGSITIPGKEEGEGEQICKLNDYLIAGEEGRFTVMTADAFEEAYTLIEDKAEPLVDANKGGAIETPEVVKEDSKVTGDSKTPTNTDEDRAETEQKTGLLFGSAIKALHAGKRIARIGWNGKGLFVFMQVPATIGAEIVPKMQSLPEAVKAEFARRFAVEDASQEINYSNQMALVNPDNTINGWNPSSSDTLAADWCILD